MSSQGNYDQLKFCEVDFTEPTTPQKKIHVVHSPDQNAFKVIVSSRDAARLVTELQKGNPHTLTAYMSFHGSSDTKWSILEDCKQHSLHGDWIQDNASVREYLNSQLNCLVG